MKRLLPIFLIIAFALAIDVARGQITISTANQTVTGTNVIPAKADPGSPATGEFWLSTTDADTLKFRSGGVTHSLVTSATLAAAYQPLDTVLTSLSSLKGPATTTLTFSSSGDTAGVVYFLGTTYLTATFANPNGVTVTVVRSSNDTGTAANLTDRTTNTTWTSNVANSWAAIDLGSGRALTPNYYSLRGTASANGTFPRNWKLQGSNNVGSNDVTGINAATWTDLDTRTSDTTINSDNAWGSFAVSGVTTGYRWLRILQTGLTSTSDNYLTIAEFEFYGSLAYTAAIPSGLLAYDLTGDSVSTVTTSAGLRGQLSDETGTGAAVFATSPTLVTPTLGVATATSINKVAITAPATSATLTIADGKTLTVSNTLTFTGTDASSVAFGAGGTVAYTANKLSAFAATTSSEFAGVITDETGTGKVVLDTSPTLVTPTLGVASATSINKVAVTAPATSATLTIADGKTFTTSNTLTLAGTDGSTLNIGTGTNLSAIAGLTSAADKLAYFTGSGTAALADFTAGGRALVNSAGTADTFPYYSASNTVTLGSITTAGRNLIDDASASAQRTTLGVGTSDSPTFAAATLSGNLIFGTSASVLNGTTGSIGLKATGTNQSITLTPSGTGSVILSSSLIFPGGGFISGSTGSIGMAATGSNQYVSLVPSGSGTILIGTDATSTNTIQFRSGSAIIESGNSPLTIKRTSSAGALHILDSGGTAGARISAPGSQAIAFSNHTGGSEYGRFVSSGNLLLGTTTDSSNGKLQLASHTTKAGGIGFGTELSLYRSADSELRVQGEVSKNTNLVIGTDNTGALEASLQLVPSGSGANPGQFKIVGSPTAGTSGYGSGTHFVSGGVRVVSLGTTGLDIIPTTASTSTTTGSTVFRGGIGVAGAGYFGGELYADRNIASYVGITIANASTSASAGAQISFLQNGNTERGRIMAGSNVNGITIRSIPGGATGDIAFNSSGVAIPHTTAATTAGAGSLTTAGGIYAAKTVVAMTGLVVDKTVTAGGTTGAQTINKPAGTVNFAAAATSLVVTNSLVTSSSIIICTVGTNDATMHSVQAVAGTGSFTLYPNAAPTGETRVNFHIVN